MLTNIFNIYLHHIGLKLSTYQDSKLFDLLITVLYRIDAWGMAMIMVMVALVNHELITGPMILLLFTIGGLYWFGYTLNDYYDAPHDALDPTKSGRNFFAKHAIPGWGLLIFSLSVMGLATAVFAQFGRQGIITLAVCSFFMWGYSAPPLRFKSRPGLDLLIHAIFVQTCPYVVTVWLIQAEWSLTDFFIISIVFFASMTGQIEQQVRDFEVDLKTDRTFVTMIGRQKAVYLLKFSTITFTLIFFAGLFSGILPLFMTPFILIVAPVVLDRLMRRNEGVRSEKRLYISMVLSLVYMSFVFGLHGLSG